MKRLLPFFAIVIFLFTKPVHSQNNHNFEISKPEYSKNYLGINTGITTGFGFSYRYWPNKNGFQVTFLPLYQKDNTYLSLGTTFIREIKTYGRSRFLCYASNHYSNFFGYKGYTDNIGIGAGFDVYSSDFIVNCMLGYAAFDVFNDLRTRPTIELGIFYNF